MTGGVPERMPVELRLRWLRELYPNVELQEQQARDLERRGISYVTVTGSVEQRVEQVKAALHIDALGFDRSVAAG